MTAPGNPFEGLLEPLPGALAGAVSPRDWRRSATA